MKTTNLLCVICICLGVAVAAVSAAFVGVLDESRGLRRQLEAGRTELRRVADKIEDLKAQKNDLTGELAKQRDERPKPESELPEAKESKTNQIPMPRPVKVRTFLGNQCVGMSWLVPSGVSKDPKSGAVTYEPILILDESVRQYLVTWRTNVVEREVAQSTTLNYNYPWVYYYPVLVPAHTNRPPHCDASQTPGSPPGKALQSRNSIPLVKTTYQAPTDQMFVPRTNPRTPQYRSTGSGPAPHQASGPIDPGKNSLAVWVPPGR